LDLEEVWRIREDDVYPKLFGVTGKGIFTLSQALFKERFKQLNVDPRWLFLGVFEFQPTATRPFWIYATSGHSNPSDADFDGTQAKGPSGSGVEFLLATKQQGEWAIHALLNLLAFDLLLRAGRYPGKVPLNEGDRIPLRSPINGDNACLIRNVLVTRVDELWPGFTLPSGSVKFLTLTGATDHEIKYAKVEGTGPLVAALRAEGYYPVTDTSRPSQLTI
jgi:hypothetical protein